MNFKLFQKNPCEKLKHFSRKISQHIYKKEINYD